MIRKNRVLSFINYSFIIEANACGIPVIVSDIEVFKELVQDGVNGLLVKQNNSAALANALKKFINKKIQFDEQIISDSIHKYDYDFVGKEFYDLFQEYYE